MATEKQSFKDRTIKKILGGRFRSGSGHNEESLNPNNTAREKRSATWYHLEGSDNEKETSTTEPLSLKPIKPTKKTLRKPSKKSVPAKVSTTTWFLHDESNVQQETSKKESPPELDVPVVRERSESFNTKKKSKPDGTFEYDVAMRIYQPEKNVIFTELLGKVKDSDTLNSIAARFDVTPSELKKLNKLASEYIFPKQVLYIPSVDRKKKEGKEDEMTVVESPPKEDKPRMDIPVIKLSDKPLSKVPGHAERQTPVTSPKEEEEFVIPHKLDEDEVQQLDQDCFERFIKVNVKHITDGQGVVSGVLLVTPNAVMFDPNVSDPLVIEHGADTYGVIAPMDMIISCAMYHDIVAMRRRKKHKDEDIPKPEIYHDKSCPHYQSWVKGHSDFNLSIVPEVTQDTTSPTGNSEKSETTSICSCGVTDQKLSPLKSPTSNKLLANQNSPAGSQDQSFEIISESSNNGDQKKMDPTKNLITDIDIISLEDTNLDNKNEISPVLIDLSESKNKTKKFFLDDECDDDDVTNQNDDKKNNEDVMENHLVNKNNSGSDITNGNKSPEELRIGNIVYMPVSENSEGEVSQKDIEQIKTTLSRLSLNDFENRDRSKSAPVDVPVVSISSKEDVAQSKSFGSIGGSLPSISPHINTFVNYATGLFRPDSRADVKDISEILEESERSFSLSGKNMSINMNEHDFAIAVESAVKLADKPNLFQSFDKLIPKPAVSYEDPPLYLCIRLGKPIKGEVSQTCPIAAYNKQKKKPEYWFSIPREKVDHLYAFFVQWKPEIYGDDEEMMAEKRGFVVLPDEGDETGDVDILDEYFGGGSLQKDWEIISTGELMKRRSIDIEVMPELLSKSSVLEEFHLQMLNTVMPPRTVGYPWSLIYSTEKHGFSLKTLYRLMQDIDSPVLLVVKDTEENVFGAMTSEEMKVSDHFYGTGESFLYTFYPEFKVFRWTGENNFFMKGNQESLSVGAGQGQFGLWFDGDIYHGRTNHCETYDNDILTTSEDFVVKCLEAWAFTDD